MIVRIVKMEFKEDNVNNFLNLFNKNKKHIRNFPGVLRLELLRDINQPNIFFTYSWWRSVDDLENYRQSDLFKTVWRNTKPLFQSKPLAWSLTQEVVLE